ncbi:MAG: undecaprenyl-diphosphate phosphatase [Pseudomonas sp.]|nr:MAG: undecaprenyl-diphosphate phosphatase [Pseudomonas sp.]
MTTLQILVLALVQGFAELLPVSSSAHVIVAQKLMGLDPSAPAMTWLLVMLHTGTMFAVIAFFWRSWRSTYFGSAQAWRLNGLHLVLATAATGVVGLGLLQLIKKVLGPSGAGFEIEQLFGNTRLMAAGLACAGLLILISSWREHRATGDMTARRAAWIGAVQGLCLPFRGFSRSGATISSGMLLGVGRRRAEEFSFALAVVLTPAVLAKEGYRFYRSLVSTSTALWELVGPGLLGMGLSFLAGLVALRWLSRWLEHGRWHFFGLYCLVASVAVLTLG